MSCGEGLGTIQRRVQTYLDYSCKGQKFEFEEGSNGWLGIGRTEEHVVIYHVQPAKNHNESRRVKVAEVGYTTKAQSSLMKAGELISRVYDSKNEKSKPAYREDQDRDYKERIFSESRLVEVASGKWQPPIAPADVQSNQASLAE